MNDPVNRVDPTGHVFVKALLDLSYRPRDRRQSYAGTSSELKKGTASSMLKRTSSLPDLTSPVTHSTTVSPSRSPEASSAEYIQPLVGSQSAPESHPIQQVNPITVSGFMNITKINLDRAFRVFNNPDATPTEIIRAASDLEEAAKKIYTRVHYSQQHNIYQ
ncbi:hypothetical protein [Pseudomonas sp. BJa3]|uniref:hypothetical protein n=1 Tax=Pseudomonas sp. BJa3 TaxID=2986525 RepID=UPI003A7F5738